MAQGILDIRIKVNQGKASQELGKFTSKLSTLGKVGGTVGGILGTVGLGAFAIKATMTAARTRELGVVMDELARVSGYQVGYIREQEKALTDLNITTQASRNVLINFMKQQLDVTKATELAKIARDAGVISMEATDDALNGIIHGLAVLQPRVLRHHGITISLEQGYKRWAEQNNRTVESLSMLEKQQIALNSVLKYGERIQGAYGAAMEEAGKRWRSVTKRYIEEMFNAVGELGIPAFEALVDWVGRTTKAVRLWAEANRDIMVDRIRSAIHHLTTSLENLIGWVNDNAEAIKLFGQALLVGAIAAKLFAWGKSIIYVVIALKTMAPALIAANAAMGIFAVAASVLAFLYFKRKYQLAEEARRINELGQEYEELAGKTERTVQEQTSMLAVQRELMGLYPELTTRLENETTAVHANADAWSRAYREIRTVQIMRELEALDARAEGIPKPAPPMTEESDVRFGDIRGDHEKERVQIAKTSDAERRRAELKGELREILRRQQADIDEDEEEAKQQQLLRDKLMNEEAARRRAKAEIEAEKLITDWSMRASADKLKQQEHALLRMYEKVADKIRTLELDDADKAKMLIQAEHSYHVQRLRIREKYEKRQRKQARESWQEEYDAMEERLQHEADVYGWSTEQWIAALEEQREIYRNHWDMLEIIEEEIREKRRDQEVEEHQERIQNYQYWRDLVVESLTDIVMRVRSASEAFKDLGDFIVRYIVRKGLTMMIDKLMDATSEAERLRDVLISIGMWKAVMGFMGGGQVGPSTFGFMGTPGGTIATANGALVRKPTFLLAGERETEAIIPLSKLPGLIREALGGAGGVTLRIDNLQAWDAAGVAESIRSGEIGEELERQYRRGWLNWNRE